MTVAHGQTVFGLTMDRFLQKTIHFPFSSRNLRTLFFHMQIAERAQVCC